MAYQSVFPKVVEFAGDVWHQVYDPADAMTTLPDLNKARVMSSTCDEVKIGSTDLWMVVVDLIIPASLDRGQMMAEKRLRGFRIYETKPLRLDAVTPSEMVYYIAEPRVSSGSAAQQFLDVLLGKTVKAAQEAAVANKTWGKDVVVRALEKREPPAVEVVPDEQPNA